MSYRVSRLSPQSTNAKDLRVVVENPSSNSAQGIRDMQFWRAWLEFDSEEGGDKPSRSRLNWNMILGVIVVVGISVGFWTGVGFLIARLME